MPLYDYGCPSCGQEREVQHSMSEIGNIEVLCDSCGKKMKKLLSAPTLIGFDNVGRSVSKKDSTDGSTKESPKEAPAAVEKPSTKKDTA